MHGHLQGWIWEGDHSQCLFHVQQALYKTSASACVITFVFYQGIISYLTKNFSQEIIQNY